jgi:hypothetical protein
MIFTFRWDLHISSARARFSRKNSGIKLPFSSERAMSFINNGGGLNRSGSASWRIGAHICRSWTGCKGAITSNVFAFKRFTEWLAELLSA